MAGRRHVATHVHAMRHHLCMTCVHVCARTCPYVRVGACGCTCARVRVISGLSISLGLYANPLICHILYT